MKFDWRACAFTFIILIGSVVATVIATATAHLFGDLAVKLGMNHATGFCAFWVLLIAVAGIVVGLVAAQPSGNGGQGE